MSTIHTIVIGGLNTDIIAEGINRFPEIGGHVYGKQLQIGPGGKSRNIAQMIARLSSANSVAMVGRTAKDPYGLWKVPYDALQTAGVNTQYITVLEESETSKMPGIALIPVDEQGNNQIFVLPGVNNDFSPRDIDAASPIFEATAINKGTLALSLECPLATAEYAVAKASKLGITVILDPGGLQPGQDITALLTSGISVLKPNAHEAFMLTGIKVTDLDSAQAAARQLSGFGIAWVLITAGAEGGYLISESTALHIPVPDVSQQGAKDETGCGDQTMAAFRAQIQAGKSREEAARIAIVAGTMQFYRKGIQPLSTSDLESAF